MYSYVEAKVVDDGAKPRLVMNFTIRLRSSDEYTGWCREAFRLIDELNAELDLGWMSNIVPEFWLVEKPQALGDALGWIPEQLRDEIRRLHEPQSASASSS